VKDLKIEQETFDLTPSPQSTRHQMQCSLCRWERGLV